MKSDFSKFRNNPKNYKWGIYYCPEDPCVIRPKRFTNFGGTINFAHPLAVPVFLLVMLAACGPTLFAVSMRLSPALIGSTVIGSVVLVILIGVVLSDRPL